MNFLWITFVSCGIYISFLGQASFVQASQVEMSIRVRPEHVGPPVGDNPPPTLISFNSL